MARGCTELCVRSHFRSSVVVPSLQEFNAIVEDFVDQAIRFIDPARPHITAKVFQRFRLPDAFRRFAQHGFHQIQHAQCRLAIRVHPIPQIFQAFILDDRVPSAFGARAQGVRSSVLRSAVKSVAFFLPRRARVSAASKRTAFSGDRSRYAVSRRLDNSSAGINAMSSWPRR